MILWKWRELIRPGCLAWMILLADYAISSSSVRGQAPIADWRRAANMVGSHLYIVDEIGFGPVLDLSEDRGVSKDAEIICGSAFHHSLMQQHSPVSKLLTDRVDWSKSCYSLRVS